MGLRVFVDSNVFIFANISNYPEHEMAKKELLELIRKNAGIIVNSIIVSEVHYKLYRLVDLKTAYERVLGILSSSFVEYLPIPENTVVKAVELSFSKNLRINDAVIAQHVLDSNADGILTDNIKDFKKVDDLPVFELRK